ncbi:hypothetical protein ABT282_30885 [Streptomyces sp. NPDC000927]|uniref:hypothetical protein n=1 Tax=Streptomyces sp. NPDC000927 TaxID=3154371 RepID=UPI00331BF3BA
MTLTTNAKLAPADIRGEQSHPTPVHHQFDSTDMPDCWTETAPTGDDTLTTDWVAVTCPRCRRYLTK